MKSGETGLNSLSPGFRFAASRLHCSLFKKLPVISDQKNAGMTYISYTQLTLGNNRIEKLAYITDTDYDEIDQYR